MNVEEYINTHEYLELE